MTFTIVYAGGEMGAFTPSDSSVTESTSFGKFDPLRARCALYAGSVGSWADSPIWASALTDCWLHFVLWPNAWNSAWPAQTLMSIYDSGATEVFRIVLGPAAGSGPVNITIQMAYWDGTAWQPLGTASSLPTGTLQHLDFHFNSTTAEWWAAGTLRESLTATMTHVTNLQRLRFWQPTGPSSGEMSASEFIVASGSLIGFGLLTLPITANGAQMDWPAGTYADVDETIYNDANGISTPTANQIDVFRHSTTVGDTPYAMVVTARAQAQGAGPQHSAMVIRVGATNYVSSSFAETVGFGADVAIWQLNPATSGLWTASVLNAIQYGVKSLA